MISPLKRHPFGVRARLERVLVVTYAVPAEVAALLLPPFLRLDAFNSWGFIAVALAQTRRLRPSFLPACFGRDFFLAGYRIFTRTMDPEGRLRRGLRILNTYTDSSLMVPLGNIFTHYSYRQALVLQNCTNEEWKINIKTDDGLGDLQLHADLQTAEIPASSPFRDVRQARRFAGPLPLTFESLPEDGGILCIEGRRKNWAPRLVKVNVSQTAFFSQGVLAGTTASLASAFYMENVSYEWRPGAFWKFHGALE